LLFAALLVLYSASAWAHAMLEGSTPADGAVIEAAPAEVVLRFNEVVTPVAVRVIDASGNAVAAAVPPAGDTIALRLPALARGSYLVSFRVVSADAHPIGGAIVFTLGAAGAAPLAAVDDAREGAWRAAAIALRGARDAGLLFAVGGALFILLVLAGGDPVARHLAPPLRVAAILAALLSLATIGIVGGLATLATSPFDGAAWAFGLATTAAPAAFATAGGLAAIAVALPARTVASRTLAALGALVAAAGPALTGHAAVEGPAAQALHAAHTLAAAFWLGALWPLLVLARGGDATAAARRFATLATLAVATLAICGIGLALMHGEGVRVLLASAYGDLLLLKLALLAALLALAAANRWWLVPRLARAPRYRAGFATALRADLALAALVVAATAALVHTPPPHEAMGAHPHDAEPGVIVAFSGAHMMTIEVAPGRAGTNTITLGFSDGGAAFAPQEVRIALAQDGAGIEPIARLVPPTGDGRFRLTGPELALAGTWAVRVEALISDFEKVTFDTRLAIR
jgi:copper transport protein